MIPLPVAVTFLVVMQCASPHHSAYQVGHQPNIIDTQTLNEIDESFDAVSNRALLYAGSPSADPHILAQMRHLYGDALNSIHQLNHQKRGPDYGEARKAVSNFIEFVDRHPPGLLVPPVIGAAD